MAYRPWELHMDRVWKRNLRLFLLKDLLFLPYKLLLAFRIAGYQTYYPELPRKSYPERVFDNLLWAVRHLEPNVYYTSYGLDIRNFHRAEDYLPYRAFKLERDGALYREPEKYRFSFQILVRDKAIFSCYLSQAIGDGAVPKTLARIESGRVILEPSKETVSIEQYFSAEKRVICKSVDGECADAVMLLEVKNGAIRNGGERISLPELETRLCGKRYLVQEVVIQHEVLAGINPYCVNTVRLITVRGRSGEIHVLAASLRIGTSRDSFVDNRAAGGMAVGIREDGTLMKYGFQHSEFGGKSEAHPVTGVIWEGIRLPYWTEAVALVKEAHRALIGLPSIGWDVALTPTGPVLLEGNDNWEIANPQDCIGGLKQKWRDLLQS